MKKRNRRIRAALNLCGTVLIIYCIATKIIAVGKESFILKNGLKQVTEPNNLLRGDDFLISHPVFKNFNITPPTRKKRVHLLIIISSAPQRYSRREAIRDTWWSHCKNQVDVECIFITDKLNPSHELFSEIVEEQERYRDIRFQNLRGGFLFGIRFIYHLVYAVLNYQFEYMLRADDDYFICLDRLLYELPKSPMSMFHWGWVHKVPGVIRPDEAINIFSKDIVMKYLYQNVNKFYCHPMGGQLIGVWTAKLNITKLFRHDPRLHYRPISRDAPHLLKEKSICKKYIGIHGAYPKYMVHFWNHRYSTDSLHEYNGDLIKNSDLVETNKVFKWEDLPTEWRYEPELCINRTKWPSKQSGHTGENEDFYKGMQGN